jgi:pimeloyl-ACP methyl ester carboxylesterase
MLRVIYLWLAAALMCALTAGVQAAPARADIVLVHGAFADGSSWSRVIPLLQKKGYRVTAVQLPLTSLADDVAATRRVLDRQTGPVVLVGHSWGGVVVSEAGNAPGVKSLVFLSALVPDSGESAQALLQRLNAPMEGMAPDAAGLIWLDNPKAFRDVMAGDLPQPAAAALAAVQKPLAASAFADAVSHAAWRDKPSWYLVTSADHALPPRTQRLIAGQLKANTEEIASSHLSMASHPAAVADLIDRAARAAVR